MGLHWLKLPQYLHILFFYWKLVFVHYYGLQSSKNFTKSQGWWLSGIALVWDPWDLEKGSVFKPTGVQVKKALLSICLWLDLRGATNGSWVGSALVLQRNELPKSLNMSLPSWWVSEQVSYFELAVYNMYVCRDCWSVADSSYEWSWRMEWPNYSWRYGLGCSCQYAWLEICLSPWPWGNFKNKLNCAAQLCYITEA